MDDSTATNETIERIATAWHEAAEKRQRDGQIGRHKQLIEAHLTELQAAAEHEKAVTFSFVGPDSLIEASQMRAALTEFGYQCSDVEPIGDNDELDINLSPDSTHRLIRVGFLYREVFVEFFFG